MKTLLEHVKAYQQSFVAPKSFDKSGFPEQTVVDQMRKIIANLLSEECIEPSEVQKMISEISKEIYLTNPYFYATLMLATEIYLPDNGRD